MYFVLVNKMDLYQILSKEFEEQAIVRSRLKYKMDPDLIIFT